MPTSKHRKKHKQKLAKRNQKIAKAKQDYNRQIDKMIKQMQSEQTESETNNPLILNDAKSEQSIGE